MKRITIRKERNMSDMQMLSILLKNLSEIKDGIYDIIIENHHEKATHRQFGWLFGGIYTRLLPAFNELGWEMSNTDDVDKFFAVMFRDKKCVNRNTGEVITIPMSLSEMNTVEMSEYCNRILDFSTQELSIDITDLLPDEFSRHTPTNE